MFNTSDLCAKPNNKSSFKIDDILKPNCDNVMKPSKYSINDIIKVNSVKLIQNQQNNSFVNFNGIFTKQQQDIEQFLTGTAVNTKKQQKLVKSNAKSHKSQKCGKLMPFKKVAAVRYFMEILVFL
jgi:hypothetical protein